MHNLPKRLLSSTAPIGLVLATLFWFPLWVFVLVVVGFIAGALYEFFTMVRNRGILVHRPLSIALGVVFAFLVAWRSLVERGLLPIAVWGSVASLLSWLWDLFWPATIVILFIRQLSRENAFEALGGVGTTFFGLGYIAALFSYLLHIRALDAQAGAWLVLYLILVTKMGDVGAYVIGGLLGRHALMARVSPRKTVEGMVGGILMSSASAVIAQPTVAAFVAPGWITVGLGVFLGACGQLGDLAESLLKRDCQVKDAGTLLPGLGGILDVIDSLLFTAPIFYGFLIYG